MLPGEAGYDDEGTREVLGWVYELQP